MGIIDLINFYCLADAACFFSDARASQRHVQNNWCKNGETPTAVKKITPLLRLMLLVAFLGLRSF